MRKINIVNVGKTKLVGLLIVKNQTILIDELRDRDPPERWCEVLEDIFINPLLLKIQLKCLREKIYIIVLIQFLPNGVRITLRAHI